MNKATLSYAASHNQKFPPPQTWDKTLLDAGLITAQVLTDPNDPAGSRSYAMNAAVTTMRANPQTVLFFECAPGSPPSGGRELLPPKPRHAGTYIIGLIDGRTISVAPESIDNLVWNPAGVTDPH